MNAVSYQFNPHFAGLDNSDIPSGGHPTSIKHNQALSIAPWDDSEASQGIISNFTKFSNVKKNLCETPKTHQPENQGVLNFVNRTSKQKKNRSELGKLRKRLEQNKNQNYHLSFNKIEFRQYQKNQSNPFFRKSLHSNPKSQVKDFSSIENNFFIKSYFFPNNPKMAKKDQPVFLEAKKQKEYRKIKEIKGPSFIAIRSVDLKQKFPIQNHQLDDSESETDEQTEKFYSTFRTISVLGSRKSRRVRNVSMQENYTPSVQLENQKYKTIESTKESSREMTDSIKEKTFLNPDQKLLYRSSKTSNNPVIITKTASFISKRESRKSVKIDLSSSNLQEMEDSGPINEVKTTKNSEKSQQDHQKVKTIHTKKIYTISREKTSRMQRLKDLKQKNDLSNFLEVTSPYVEEKPQRISNGSRLRKRFDTINMNKTLRIFDRMIPRESQNQ